MSFKDILGHRELIDALVRAHRSEMVHHAYLFSGPEGVGKARVANAFAALMNCEGKVDGADDACGECRHCRRLMNRESAAEHPDVIRLEPDGRTIKIAQIREMLRIVPYAPLETRYRVVIIDPADAMGPEAANALLKTLEEPSRHTRFILVTHRPAAMLVTIRSRCQAVIFGRLDTAQLAQHLGATCGLDEASAQSLAAIADGSLGGALALLEDPVMRERDALVRRILSVADDDRLAAFELAQEFADARGSLATIFQILTRLYRDLLLIRVGDSSAVLAHPHMVDELRVAAGRLGAHTLMHRLELIDETARGIRERYLNPKLGLERLMVSLTGPPGAEARVVGVGNGR